MEFTTSPLLPVILVILLLVGTVLAYRSGRKKEQEIQLNLATEVEQNHIETVNKLKTDYGDKLKVLNKANANEVEKIHNQHQLQLEELKEQQHKSLESIENGYLKETEQLNSKHNQLVQKLTQDNTQKIEQLQKEHEVHIVKVIDKSEEISATLQEKFDRELGEVKEENQSLQDNVSELKKELFDLRHKMEQDSQNNMHSLSKSGDKLIRVVRSVQELANELDETSRTVTGGEYSFFEEIQDQRDREAVLSLTHPKGNGANKTEAEEE